MSQLPLPIAPELALSRIIVPALGELGDGMDSPPARVLMLAIALQESGLTARHQVGGPAHGLWQFEAGGGVRGVLTHSASQRRARALCELHGIAPTVAAMYDAIEGDDLLAAGFARLLLWTLPLALPAIGDEQGAWEQYIEAWRPGQPHRDRWASVYPLAVRAVQA
ncbi:hypothetical protein [Xanthomonas translucens]|uniref:hypothetical protein n=1 Tax=Xanthomonas campestris pv. translucens TaxID=343 RepID=UPI00071BEB98|nr:hypothetical protein [Xanthomonas translucens]MCT8281768.1 hypothetical protein [Xanthomonas translucens pv. undulosa]MCT8316478.1 hypothetical protein [Xanthomonas translucens pv. undulosa]UKE38282.1 hypothetical protein KCU58_10940 [Xanthomonas translucens pv. undulosa]